MRSFAPLSAWAALALLTACGAAKGRPSLPPPEYEEPAPPTPLPSATPAPPTPAPAPSQ
jgi:hypothetical protein